MALKWFAKLNIYIEKVAYCFSRSSNKFPGHTGKKIDALNPILSDITRPVKAIKSLRFAFLAII